MQEVGHLWEHIRGARASCLCKCLSMIGTDLFGQAARGNAEYMSIWYTFREIGSFGGRMGRCLLRASIFLSKTRKSIASPE